jgi:hypothetical protein
MKINRCTYFILLEGLTGWSSNVKRGEDISARTSTEGVRLDEERCLWGELVWVHEGRRKE